MSIRLGVPASPMQTTRPPGSTTPDRRRRHLRVVGGIDDGVDRHVRQAIRRPARAHAEAGCQVPARLADARRGGPPPRQPTAKAAASSPIVPAPHTSTRIPGPACAAAAARQALPPGSTIAPARSSTVSGRWMEAATGTPKLLGERARKPVRDTDLDEVATDMTPAGQASVAPSAGEHRVARDPPTDPRRVHAVTDGTNHAAPLVAGPHRIGRPAGGQVGHRRLTPVRGPSRTRPTRWTAHHRVARTRRRDVHVLDPRQSGPGQDECAHGAHRPA